ncbi:MAG: DMT family transporter [Verrucomicrobiota bacterium]|nr:DMT family transporter [Verrucomicrobiota bacterium]
MITATIYSILACLFWGFIFVAPLYLAQFDCIDIVLGRFLAFGIGSLVSLSYSLFRQRDWQLLRYWKEASLCGIVMNLCYFTALTAGMRLSNPSLITLIVGLAPILIIALTCGTKKGDMPYSTLLGPGLCIFLGIALLNIETLQANWQAYSGWQYIEGILCGLFALGAWSWYVIYNTKLLQKNPTIQPTGWTSLIGVVTLIFTIIAALFRWKTIDPIYAQLFSFEQQGILFLTSSLVLGLLCSLFAFSLWNIASAKLPSALSGQLAILETVFGLVLINLFEHHIPSPIEMTGILCILGGVWRGLYRYTQRNSKFGNLAKSAPKISIRPKADTRGAPYL